MNTDHSIKKSPTSFKNASGSSRCCVWLEFIIFSRLTLGICIQGSRHRSCTSSYLPFVTKVGTWISFAASPISQSFRLPKTMNSDGPCLLRISKVMILTFSDRQECKESTHIVIYAVVSSCKFPILAMKHSGIGSHLHKCLW